MGNFNLAGHGTVINRSRCRSLGFVSVLVTLLFVIIWPFRGFLSILNEPHDNFETIRIERHDSDPIVSSDSGWQIPKIIHQTYRDHNIPDHWKAAQQSCLALHQDWEYKFWTDEDATDFITREYPWFLKTWHSYKYPIQRADAIRYFALAHYGGIYIDLDDLPAYTTHQGCNHRLSPLLAYPAWLPLTAPVGVSNDVMGSAPHHPFFEAVIRALERYNRDWASPYLTVMYSTGPMFLSEIRRDYLAATADPHHTTTATTTEGGGVGVGEGVVDPAAKLYTLMPEDYDRNGESMFRSYRGSSWHAGDAKVIFWMGDHWRGLVALGVFAGGCAGYLVWRLYCRVFQIACQW